MNTNRPNLRGGSTLFLLALLAGLMAILVAGPKPEPVALGQIGGSMTPPTDDGSFDSPIPTPTLRPTPYPILPITDPTLAYVLWLRNSFFEGRFGAPPTGTPPWTPRRLLPSRPPPLSGREWGP